MLKFFENSHIFWKMCYNGIRKVNFDKKERKMEDIKELIKKAKREEKKNLEFPELIEQCNAVLPCKFPLYMHCILSVTVDRQTP